LTTALCTVALVLVAKYLPEKIDDWREDIRIKNRQAIREKREQLVSEWKANPPSSLEMVLVCPPRFDVDDPQLLAHLDEHGYAVVAAVATPTNLEKANDLLWEWLSDAASWVRGDPETWTDSTFRAIGDPTNGLVNGNGFGHSRLAWYVRTLPRVKRAFEVIWNTGSLITSFDGGNIFRPHNIPGLGQRSARTRSGWWHVDQGRQKQGRCSVQGFVSLTRANSHTGGLCVVPGSHRGHDELMSYAAMNDNDYVAVPEPACNPAIRGAVLVGCEPGDMVLWDSRTIHCNTPTLTPPSLQLEHDRESQPETTCVTELLRAVVYVCMTPKCWASRSTLRDRRLAFAAGIGSTHWPHDFRPVAPTEQAFSTLDEVRVKAALESAEDRVAELVG